MNLPNDTFRYADRSAALEAAEKAGLDLDELVVKQVGGVWGWLKEGEDDAPAAAERAVVSPSLVLVDPDNTQAKEATPQPALAVVADEGPALASPSTMDPNRAPQPGDRIIQYLGPQPAVGALLMAEELAKQHEGFFLLIDPFTGNVTNVIKGKSPRGSSGLTADQNAKLIEMCSDDDGATVKQLKAAMGVKKTTAQWKNILGDCKGYRLEQTATIEDGRPVSLLKLRPIEASPELAEAAD